MAISDFFKDKDGELSSKRLVGLVWAAGFAVGTPLLAIYLVHKASYRDAVDLWTSFGWATMAILGVGVVENFGKNGTKRSVSSEKLDKSDKQ